MKKLLMPILLSGLLLCGCDAGSEDIKKEDVESYVVENASVWDDEFEDVFFTNFSMNVHYTGEYDGTTLEVNNTMYADANGVFIEYKYTTTTASGSEVDQNSFYIIKENDQWVGYRLNEAGTGYIAFRNGEVTEEDYLAGVKEGQLNVSFKSCYEQFTFNEEKMQYEAAGPIRCELDEEIYQGSYILAYDCAVKFEQGKLTSMKATYEFYVFDSDTSEYSNSFGDMRPTFEIYDINKTVVTAPTNIVTE